MNKTTIEQIMATNTNISLKRMCEELGLCYQYVLKLSKTPVKGETYDPNVRNYVKIQDMINAKHIDIDVINWASINASIKTSEPINSFDDMDYDTEFTLKGGCAIYRCVYKTCTHIVFLQVGESQPRVMNKDTFNHQAPRITK